MGKPTQISPVNIIQTHFEGARASSNVFKNVVTVLEKHGYTQANTLYAQSVCADEINHKEGNITNLFSRFWGKVFGMGGLAGIPFTGTTGFGAFSHHVPDDGHLFVLMAPHIGISESNALGKYTRCGQRCEGTACGAAVGAFKHCCTHKVRMMRSMSMSSLRKNVDDFQMSYIINEMNKRKASILKKPTEDEREAEIARQTWEISKNMLNNVLSTDFGGESSTLVVLTGIQINMPSPHEDYFMPLSFEIHTKDGKKEDILKDSFLYDVEIGAVETDNGSVDPAEEMEVEA